ncbi:MAG: hypothetical protein Kow0069_28710 [Promethearchaeota archaeon]
MSSSLVVGTVVTSPEGPSNVRAEAVLLDAGRAGKRLVKGQFCCVPTPRGLVLANVVEIRSVNSYFENPQTVKEFERDGGRLGAKFPVGAWEYQVGVLQLLGRFDWTPGPAPLDDPDSWESRTDWKVDRVGFPPSPGDRVYLVPPTVLVKFLGLDLERGVHLGQLREGGLPAKFSLHRTFNRHVAVLAVSGAGKSYLVGVLVEELLLRRPEHGRPAVVVFDVHGEYAGMASGAAYEGAPVDLSSRVDLVDAVFCQFAVPLLSPWELQRFETNMSPAQVRELAQAFQEVRKAKGDQFDLVDLMDHVAGNEAINQKTKEALNGWLYGLSRTALFAATENPNVASLLKPGRAVIFDLSGFTSLKKRQMVVHYFLNRMFQLRRQGAVCPFVVVIEEAHQFVPEGVGSDRAISRSIVETVAREGRKFFAQLCLVSQRPVRLSVTALSQCNTHVIMRLVNPYDLDHVRASSEYLTREVLGAVSSLPTGECLVLGNAVNYPVFVKVRRRLARDARQDQTLEREAAKYDPAARPVVDASAVAGDVRVEPVFEGGVARD